jgi:hypothetical protein
MVSSSGLWLIRPPRELNQLRVGPDAKEEAPPVGGHGDRRFVQLARRSGGKRYTNPLKTSPSISAEAS